MANYILNSYLFFVVYSSLDWAVMGETHMLLSASFTPNCGVSILIKLFRTWCGSWFEIQKEGLLSAGKLSWLFWLIIPAKTVEVIAVPCCRSQHWLDSQAENLSAFSALDGVLHFDRAIFVVTLTEINSKKSWSSEGLKDTIQQLMQHRITDIYPFLLCWWNLNLDCAEVDLLVL